MEDSPQDTETRKSRLCSVINSALILALICLLFLAFLQKVYANTSLSLHAVVSSKVQVWYCRENKRARLLTFFILGHSGQHCWREEGKRYHTSMLPWNTGANKSNQVVFQSGSIAFVHIFFKLWWETSIWYKNCH